MTVTVDDIRVYPLNDMPVSDLGDESIQGALDQAVIYVDSVKRGDATETQLDAATRALAGYNAYVNYFDRPVADVAGSFQDGYFTPSSTTDGIPNVKPMNAMDSKRKALKETAEIMLSIISIEPIGDIPAKPVPFMSITA